MKSRWHQIPVIVIAVAVTPAGLRARLAALEALVAELADGNEGGAR